MEQARLGDSLSFRRNSPTSSYAAPFAPALPSLHSLGISSLAFSCPASLSYDEDLLLTPCSPCPSWPVPARRKLHLVQGLYLAVTTRATLFLVLAVRTRRIFPRTRDAFPLPSLTPHPILRSGRPDPEHEFHSHPRTFPRRIPVLLSKVVVSAS